MTQYNALPKPIMPQICWPTSLGVGMMDKVVTFFQGMKVGEGGFFWAPAAVLQYRCGWINVALGCLQWRETDISGWFHFIWSRHLKQGRWIMSWRCSFFSVDNRHQPKARQMASSLSQHHTANAAASLRRDKAVVPAGRSPSSQTDLLRGSPSPHHWPKVSYFSWVHFFWKDRKEGREIIPPIHLAL